jgi:hypothetical protein
MGKGFKGDEAQAWNEFTTLAMNSIPDDVRNDRNFLSVMDMLALTDILPPEICYPSTLCTTFHSRFAFGDTKISMEEQTRRAVEMKVNAEAQQAYMSRARDGCDKCVRPRQMVIRTRVSKLASSRKRCKHSSPQQAKGSYTHCHLTEVRTD